MRRLLVHPLAAGRDLDAPETTALRRRIIAGKGFLRRLYGEWYALLAGALPPGGGAVLELGSGGGFLAEAIPGLLTSDLLPLPHVRCVLDATRLPFADGSLKGVVMTNVLHHVRRPADFLEEAARCVRPGGVIAMVEPWSTPWARLVYRRLHPEPFDPAAASWELPQGGPLSGANGALPWILFARDRARLEAGHPAWRISRLEVLMPAAYLLSGGVSLRGLAPGWAYPLWRALERPFEQSLGMFALVVLERTTATSPGGGRG